MISTQIFLSGATYSGYTAIDLYKDEPIDLIYSVADVRNISNRNSTFSKTISFPASSKNSVLLNHIFEIGADSNFNPHKKTPCFVSVDSIPVIENAFFQLTDIVLDFSKNIAEYKGVIFANNFDFFKSMGSHTIDELPWSGINWILKQANIESSWTAGTQNKIVYPLVDRNYGWSYPAISPAGNSPIGVEAFRPCIYEKALVDLIFSENGFTYQSNFLNSDYFGNLILDGLAQTEVKCDYNLHLDMGLSYSTGHFSDAYCIFEVQLVRQRPSGSEVIIASANVDWDPTLPSLQTFDFAGTALVTTNDKIYTKVIFWEYSKMDYWVNHYGGASILTLDYQNTTTGDMQVKSTTSPQQFYFFPAGSSGQVIPEFPTVVYDADSTWNGSNQHTVPNFLAVEYVRSGIKQADYISWLINSFNLYIDVDSSQPNCLLIEPRADFYSSNTGSTKDWTNKLDISKPIEVKLLSELQDRQITFTYKEDNDKLNTQYKTSEKRIYGDEIISFDNDFLTSEKKIEIGFSPTPLQNVPGSTEIIVPAIYPVDSNSTTEAGYNVRRLYYGGLLNLPTNKIKIQYLTGTSASYTYYPYAGELDNPIYPTFSIMYGTPLVQYFNNNNPTGLYPNTNLYSTYWKGWIQQISSKNSKLITCYINLKPSDINQFAFNDVIFLAGQEYIVNKITYNALGDSTSKVELLKIEPVTPETPEDKKSGFRKGAGNGITVGKNDIFNQQIAIGTNNYNNPSAENIFSLGEKNSAFGNFTDTVLLFGSGNTVGSSASTISAFGTSNKIGSATDNIFIVGSGNTVDTNTSNLILLNINNLSATTGNSNTVIANQVLVQSALTANSIFVNYINGYAFSALTGSTTVGGNYLPISGGTVTGATEIQNKLYVSGGYRVNTQIVKNFDFTAATSDYFITVDSSLALKVYLPQSPPRGTYFIISDMNGNANVNNITVQPISTGDTIQYQTGYTIGTAYQAIHLIYYDLTSDYQIVSSR